MGFNQIPVNGLTHAYFSFAFISPGDFKVIPMPGMSPDLFSDFTAIKKRNPDLKTVIAVGGWTHNDPGPFQTVFSDMVSTKANRDLFIGNLFGFMRRYGFDGVDIDWEYPGAPDRGGTPADGANFLQFLKELDEANFRQPSKYVVSLTIPTSYWYLRHFPMLMYRYIDFINVMSYDLHGVWDADNPIGANIYARMYLFFPSFSFSFFFSLFSFSLFSKANSVDSNLTEIKEALNLLWRNFVPANKVNLGIGFYGRSFTLTDPGCTTPGCGFRGGANPGPCSQNSGTLTYREIQHIIQQRRIKPVHDRVAAVKWITWDRDQWVSYDDAETIQQKIDFANAEGLSGLLIWAIDQDTADLEALRGILGPQGLNKFVAMSQTTSWWDDAAIPDCYVTDCGGTCRPGFVRITQQPCGNAKPVTRHSDKPDSQLCCPLTAAPDPSTCRWRGGWGSCNGRCHEGEVTLQTNKWGDGWYCEDGVKVYCCDSPVAKRQNCYWAGVGQHCNGEDVALTFKGTFLQTIGNIAQTFGGVTGTALVNLVESTGIEALRLYCCPPEDADEWENCRWFGTPGSCHDNHCPPGKKVQVAESDYGEGEDCYPRLERRRVFCCDPVNGKSPFLPVPLGNLFPNPPGAGADTSFELKTDDTWGTGSAQTGGGGEDPGDAAFSFVVLTSPDELQVSLDKRDGSHWHLDCDDAHSDNEEEQTIRMVCTDTSESSNCGKIGLGHGVPGTILQMPAGCGPGKYAVAKSMTPSKNQVLPRGVEPREDTPVVYDLTFDYDFRRVPRDFGNTQLRIDFSNQQGYWDEVVAAAASTKKRRKRSMSLDEVGGNHKRWLEEEFREDLHFGALESRHELHERWFGSSVIDWLTRMLKPEVTKTFRHNLDETYTAKIIEERWSCPGRDGSLLAQAEAKVQVGTSFGFTLIASSIFPLDLSNSFLVFNNKGHIECTFTVDAVARFHYDSGETNVIPPIPFPGASLRIPGIATIGPALALKGRIEASATVSATLEAKLDVVSWEYEYRLPAAISPSNPDPVDYGDSTDKNNLMSPTFYAGVQAQGSARAHLIPALQFGVEFDKYWGGPKALATVQADSWVELRAAAGISTTGTCPFTWGLDVGVDLTAQATGFGWTSPPFRLPGSGRMSVYPGGTCPDISPSSKRDVPPSLLEKRGISIGPLIPNVPVGNFICPNAGEDDGTPCESVTGWEAGELDSTEEGVIVERGFEEGDDEDDDDDEHGLEKRNLESGRTISFCDNRFRVRVPPYHTRSTIQQHVPGLLWFDYDDAQTCNDFDFGQQPSGWRPLHHYASEHILELQMVARFIDEINTLLSNSFDGLRPQDLNTNRKTDLCTALNEFWAADRDPARRARDTTRPKLTITAVGGGGRDPIDFIMLVFPSTTNAFHGELVLLENGVNKAKERMWGQGRISDPRTMAGYMNNNPNKAVKNLKDVLTAMRYMEDTDVENTLVNQAARVGARLLLIDNVALPAWTKIDGSGTWGQWTSKGLGNLWTAWIRQRSQKARDKGFQHITDYLAELEDRFINNVPAGVTVPQVLVDKIEAFRDEWDNYRVIGWTNPL